MGPGTFSLPDKSTPFDAPIQVGDEPEIVYDFQIDRPTPSDSIAFILREEGPNGAPVSEARVFALRELRPHSLLAVFSFHMKIESPKRFKIKRPRHIAGFYASSPDGSLAGFARLSPKSPEVTILLKPATKLRGRVVLPDGRSVPRAKVQGELFGVATRDLSLTEGAKEGGGVFLETLADSEGCFELTGIPIGAKVRIDSQLSPVDLYSGRMDCSTPITMEIKDAQPLSMPDLVLKPYRSFTARP